MKNHLILALLGIFTLLPTQGFCRGGEETNGGDGVVAEFFFAFDNIISLFPEDLHYSETLVFTKKDLRATRQTVSVSSAPNLYLNDKEVMAINKPYANPPSITISQSLWKNLDFDAKQHLVLHEILPILGHQDKDYGYSSWISQRIFRSNSQGWLNTLQALRACRREAIQSLTWGHLQRLDSQYSLNEVLNTGLYQGCAILYTRLFEIGVPANTCINETSDDMQFSTALSFMIRKLKQEPEIFWELDIFKSQVQRMIQLGADPHLKCHRNDLSACDHFSDLRDSHRGDDSFEFLQKRCLKQQ